jgi:polyribonucleotide nucleotidyltransferase
MGKPIATTTSFQLPDGRTVTIETGKLATQADGAVVVRMGNTMLFASVVSAREPKPDPSFFPLSVDYQEKFAAAGRIPGNFFRREARINDYEILICRLVDRAIRPLFPDGYMNETQIIINLISSDPDTNPDALAALAASAALAVSDIPFAGPISEVRVARIDGKYVINPGKADQKRADLDIIVAATMQDVTMVEGEGDEILEADLVEAIKIGHEAIKLQIEAQLRLAELVGPSATIKRLPMVHPSNPELKQLIADKATAALLAVASEPSDKSTRKDKFKEVWVDLETTLISEMGDEYPANKKMAGQYYDKLKKQVIRKMVLDTSIRLDGRKLDEVRPIWTEVDYLPSTHGSAIFNRGETQALTSVTLGTKLDEQMIDIAQELSFDKFILHYNFPGFSVGEVKPQRGPGRREVGHANLAARTIKKVLPETPYTIRIVSDILESNGSSSMATVCAGSLALLDAGVALTAPVAGIAMGMISEEGRHAILSDILGDEDALGDMDFKLTGTEKGICGCQMDIKVDGLPYEKLLEALNQARFGRIHILNEMAKTMSVAREDYKPHAPRIIEIRIERSFIGAIIGPGGSIIQDMQRKTGAVINITEEGEEGIINVASPNQESIEKAVAMIKNIIFIPEEGAVYDGVVRELVEFGAFIDFKGKSGLLHVSEISYSRVASPADVLSVGQEIQVKVLEVDKKTGKFRLSMKALLEAPEGYVPREPRRDDRSGPRRDDRGPRRDDRGPRR